MDGLGASPGAAGSASSDAAESSADHSRGSAVWYAATGATTSYAAEPARRGIDAVDDGSHGAPVDRTADAGHELSSAVELNGYERKEISRSNGG